MKIVQLLSGFATPLNNEEYKFVESHAETLKVTSLSEHDQWIAQNLVRKGVYSMGKDSNTLTKSLHEKKS